MRDFLKKFNTVGLYETWLNSNNYIEPSVSHTLDNDIVHYQNIPDYSKCYLTFKAIEDTTFKFTTNSLQYSIDNGSTWTTLAANTASPTITTGNKILWKQTGLTPNSNGIGTFSATGNFNVYGNVMSLYYGDNFVGQTDLTGKDYAFYQLFNGNKKLVSAENLILQATTLASYCYSQMFYQCSALTTAPELPATTLATNCYRGMFVECTSLTTAPELPVTTLAGGCYQSMFKGCSSLTTAPALPATTLVSDCYFEMFYNCTALTNAPIISATTLAYRCCYMMFSYCTALITAPVLSATTLGEQCYSGMFWHCTSLINAPTLPATTLVSSCYSSMFKECTSLVSAPIISATKLAVGCCVSMFRGCTALTNAPVLYATTLISNCYSQMFYLCKSLTRAPELHASTLVANCYNEMFFGCTSLNYIKCLATKNLNSGYSTKWVYNVASEGTFIKASGASWPSGVNGIPSGWTV